MRPLSLLAAIVSLICTASIVYGQEFRGTITGRVTDPQGAVVPGAAMVATNIATNVASRTTSNNNGYFEILFLNPGVYSVSAEMTGFKKAVRPELQLNVGDRLDIGFVLEIGLITESVVVTASAPLLETTTASSGRVIDRRQIMELPVRDLNPFTLTALAAGMQWTGSPVNTKPFDLSGVSSFNTMGGVGQNEYTIDGAPVTGTNRRVGFVPPADAVEEFKLETISFDAAYGHTSGAVVNVMTKAGTNTFHGSLYDMHYQQRWNATPHFLRLAFEDQVSQGLRKPDEQKQDSGRSNNLGGTFGGPVLFPKIYNGKDKFFFFFGYNGIFERRNQNPESSNFTVPKEAWRNGDFSDLLAIDAVKYTVYDPRSARQEGNRVVRMPFPGNKGVPVLNPSYKYYEKMYPLPNNVPGVVSPEGFNNYYTPEAGAWMGFNSLMNRYDYNISERHRVFGRWYWNHSWDGGRGFNYAAIPDLNTKLNRINKGIGADYVWTIGSAHILNASLNWTRFSEGNIGPGFTAFKAADVGLPAYLDEKAGDYHMLPAMTFSNLTNMGTTYPALTARGGTGEGKVSMTSIRGNHTFKYGWQERRYLFSSAGPGASAGTFGFDNSFMRAADNTTTASSHGLEWAAFMMGLPSSIMIDTNDSGYFSTRYRAFYLNDDWRVSGRLHLNLGLRYEREGGITERFDRGIGGGFLYDATLPFSEAAQAAYALSPLAELPAAQFVVRGGTQYLGGAAKTFTAGTHHVMPRAGVAFQWNNRTVLRAGYGWYYDTFNANNSRPSQYGFSQPTSTSVTADNGLTFCCGVGSAANISSANNTMTNPFPVRADGTRFDSPYGNSLGLIAMAGRGLTFTPADFSPAWQQRWRFGLQRQLRPDTMVELAYSGSYAKIWVSQRLDYLPAQYWATGNVRNQAIDDDLNRNVPNPFYVGKFASLQTSNPVLYNYLRTLGFFSNASVRKHQLLRAFPQMNGLYGLRPGVNFADANGGNKYHDLQVQFEKRFSHGMQSAVMYTRAYGSQQDQYYQEFDSTPSWRPNNSVRPHRLVWNAIYELPFGRGKTYANSGPVARIAGNWQLSWIYQYQSGPVMSFSNRFFYGDIGQLASLLNHDQAHSQNIHAWFDPTIVYKGTGAVPQGFTGFEGRSSQQPGTYQVRVFPSYVDALRSDGLRAWDVKLLRRFAVAETLKITFAVDAMNLTNHTNFGAPNTDPTNKNFGMVTAQNGLSRVLQFHLRVEF